MKSLYLVIGLFTCTMGLVEGVTFKKLLNTLKEEQQNTKTSFENIKNTFKEIKEKIENKEKITKKTKAELIELIEKTSTFDEYLYAFGGELIIKLNEKEEEKQDKKNKESSKKPEVKSNKEDILKISEKINADLEKTLENNKKIFDFILSDEDEKSLEKIKDIKIFKEFLKKIKSNGIKLAKDFTRNNKTFKNFLESVVNNTPDSNEYIAQTWVFVKDILKNFDASPANEIASREEKTSYQKGVWSLDLYQKTVKEVAGFFENKIYNYKRTKRAASIQATLEKINNAKTNIHNLLMAAATLNVLSTLGKAIKEDENFKKTVLNLLVKTSNRSLKEIANQKYNEKNLKLLAHAFSCFEKKGVLPAELEENLRETLFKELKKTFEYEDGKIEKIYNPSENQTEEKIEKTELYGKILAMLLLKMGTNMTPEEKGKYRPFIKSILKKLIEKDLIHQARDDFPIHKILDNKDIPKLYGLKIMLQPISKDEKKVIITELPS